MSLTDQHVKQLRAKYAQEPKPTNEQFEAYAKTKPHLYGNIEAEETKPKFHTTELRNPPEAVFSCGEAMKPQEPVAIVELEEPDEPITWRRAKLTSLGLKLPHGAKLYTAPQPCQRCADLEAEFEGLKENIQTNDTLLIEQGDKLAHYADRIAELEAERDKAWSINPTVSESVLIAERDALKKDAERYRWMRHDILSRYNQKDKSYFLDWDHRGKCSGYSDEWPDVDEIIDAAMEKS